MKKALIAAAAVVVVAVVAGGAWLLLSDRNGEKTARGTCGNTAYDLSVRNDDGGLKLTFELQSAAPGETWNVVVEQDGRSVLSGDRQTDEDAELDADVLVNESDGTSFTVTATPRAARPARSRSTADHPPETLEEEPMKRTIALTTAATLVAGPAALAVVLAGPAQADGPERQVSGSVAGARYHISADKEDGRYEVDADLDGVPAGSSWRMVVRHDGRKVATRTARAVRDDGRYDVDFAGVRRPDSAGRDVFKVTLTRTDGAGSVTRTLTFAR
ncbi:hypothetical protein GCM10027062_08320 [Nocardioides hungaricus]